MSESTNKKKIHRSHIVCSCKQVTLAEIIHAIEEQGARTLDDIGKLTEAGTCCGCCRSAKDDFGEEKMELYITQIIEKFVK